MEKKFKLKSEARQFFDEDLHQDIEPLSFWKEKMIHERLLNEVERVYVVLGHSSKLQSGANYKSIAGWSQEQGEAHYHFTLKIRDVAAEDYYKIDKTKLLEEIQESINNYVRSITD